MVTGILLKIGCLKPTRSLLVFANQPCFSESANFCSRLKGKNSGSRKMAVK